MSRMVYVSFEVQGKRWICNTVGNSAFEAARNAYRFFHKDYWHGPRPTLETVFLIQWTGEERKIFVRAKRALEAE